MNEVIKIRNLREDLEMELTALNAPSGTAILIRPKSDKIELSKQYMNWLVEVFTQIRPDLKFFVLPSNDFELEKYEGIEYII